MTRFFGKASATREVANSLNTRLLEHPELHHFSFHALSDTGDVALGLFLHDRFVMGWESESPATLYRCAWSCVRHEHKVQLGVYKPW